MLNLGNVTFGLEAQTGGLERSINKLRAFGSVVDKAAASQEKGAQRTVRALATQERAVKSALQQVLNLNQQIRKSGAPPEQLARNTRAFQGLTNAMTSGQLSVVSFNRTQDRFRANMGRSARALKDFKTGKPAGEVGRFAEVIRDLESASVLAVGPLSGLGARIRALGAIFNRSSFAIAAFLGGITAVIVVVSKLSAAAVRSSLAMDKIEGAFRAASGSALLASKEFEFARNTAVRLGLDLASTASGYSKIVAAAAQTNLTMSQTRKIFTGVVTAARALNLSAEDTTGTLRALEQMMSKGTVQAEELRGQLGDRLPGAFGLAAKAMGVTTQELNKMLKKGEVLSEDLLPKLATVLIDTFGSEAEKQAGKLGASIQNLSTTTFEFNRKLDDTLGITDKFKGLVDTAARAIRFLTENMDTLIASLGAITGAVIALQLPAFIGLVTSLGGAFVVAVKAIKATTSAMWLLNVAMLANPAGATLALFARIGLVLVGAAAGFTLVNNAMKKSIKTSEALNDTNDEFLGKQQSVIDGFDKMSKGIKEQTKVHLDETRKQLEADLALIDQRKIMLQQALEPRITSQKFGTVGTAPKSEIAGIENELELLEKQLGVTFTQFNKLTSLMKIPIEANGIDEASKEFEKARDKVEDLIRELEGLQKVQSIVDAGGSLAIIERAEALNKATEILKDISAKEIKGLESFFDTAGIQGNSVLEMLATAIQMEGSLSEAIDVFKDKLETTKPSLMEFNDALQGMKDKTAALAAGPDTFKAFESAADRAKTIEKWREELEKTTLSTEEINAKLRELDGILKGLDDAEIVFEEMEEAAKDLAKVFDKVFSSLEDSLVDFFTTGKFEAADFANDILREINRIAIQAAIIAPLKNLVLGNTGGGGGGGGGGGDFFGAIGGVIAGLFSEGGVSSSPTSTRAVPLAAFSGASSFAGGGLSGGGIPSILHDDEAVVPLSGGRSIPVELSESSAQTTTVNIIVSGVTNVDEFRKSTPQIMAETQRELARVNRRNN